VIVIKKFTMINDIGLFFKNTIGAIDGTHVPCVVTPGEQPRFIGRKGVPTQNIMVVCDWNMCFTFVLVVEYVFHLCICGIKESLP